MNNIFEEIATRFEHDENKRNIHDHQHTDGSYAPLIKSPTFHNPKQLALPTFYLGKTVEEWRMHSGSGTGDFEDKESFKVEKHKISINYKNEGREEKTNVKKNLRPPHMHYKYPQGGIAIIFAMFYIQLNSCRDHLELDIYIGI